MSAANKEFKLSHIFKGVSKLEEDKELYSPNEEHFNIPWYIEILRKTDHLAVYFYCDKLKENGIDWSIDVEYEITLKSSKGKRITKKTDYQFTKDEGYGFSKFMNWDTLIKDYLIDDSIIIEATVKITNMTGILKKALKSFEKSNEKYSDVVLSVEDKKFFVLKKFLAFHSTYFEALLLGKFKEAKKSEVTLNDINSPDFQNLLELLYGETAIDNDSVDGILHLAHMRRKLHAKACSSRYRPDIDAAEIALTVSKMNNSTALGPDGVTQAHLKHLPTCAFNMLADIFRASLCQNKIPMSWKKSHVLMIPKPGKDPMSSGNYRPIALISPIGKLLEKLVLKRVSEAIAAPPLQHGFKKKHSTTTAVTEIVNLIVGGMNQPKPPARSILVCLDLKAAFDTVSHSILFKEIAESTMEPMLAKWIINYIHKRRVKTCFDNDWSNWRTIKGGVPQGGVLSPALFNFYVRDIPTDPTVEVICYADDTSILSQDSLLPAAAQKMQTHLDKMAIFFEARKLKISPSKSTCTCFSAFSGDFRYDPGLTWKGTLIPTENECRILGVYLDSMMCMRKQEANIKKKIQSQLNQLKGMTGTKWGCNKELMLDTFKAITKAGATYACQSWSQLIKKTRMDSLEAAYRSGLRICCGLSKDTPAHHIYDEAGVLPLTQEIDLMNQQYAIAMSKSADHPSHGLKTRRKAERKTTASSKPPRIPPLNFDDKTLDDWKNSPGTSRATQNANHTKFVEGYLKKRPVNRILGRTAPKIAIEETELPRETRSELARLRCGHSRLCEAYIARIEEKPIQACMKCGGKVKHLLRCFPAAPLSPTDLWKKPKEVAEALGLSTIPFDPGGNSTSPRDKLT